MEEGKTVFTGNSKSGLDIVIRYPQISDVQVMLDYINALSREETYVAMQGVQKTLEEEQKFLEQELKLISEHKALLLLAFNDDTLIGIANLQMGKEALGHVAGLGISVESTYRGKGIGSLLMKNLLEEAEKTIHQLRIVTLQAFGVNESGIALYKKFGFQTYGKLPEGLYRRGEYSEEVLMYKKIK